MLTISYNITMTNRGFTIAERQQHLILTARAASQPATTCPVCGSATRQSALTGTVLNLCADRACSWEGEPHLPELQAAVKAEMGIGGVA